MNSKQETYLVLYNTNSEGLVHPSWGPKMCIGFDELEAEVTAVFNEIEDFDDEEFSENRMNDIYIFRLDESFDFKTETTEKVVTTTSVKLEHKRLNFTPLKEISNIKSRIEQSKRQQSITLLEETNE